MTLVEIIESKPNALTVEELATLSDCAMRRLSSWEVRMRANDVHDMTVRDLIALAEEVRSAPAGSRQLRRAADRMAQVAWALGGGALQQLIWWAPSTMPEGPPDGVEEPEPPPRGRVAAVVVMPIR